MIEQADLQAAGDVFSSLYMEADGFDAQHAIVMLTEARKVKAQLDAAISELETQALRGLEQPMLIGSTAWSKVRDIKRRPEQHRVNGRVAGLAAVDPMTGELRGPREAAERAVTMMAALYVSPSSVPKTGGLKEIGLTLDEVTTEEFTGYKLKQTEIA